MESVGFVNNRGIALSSLSSDAFKNGDVLIQLYKSNTPENRKKFLERKIKDTEKINGINSAVTEIGIATPELGEIWNMTGTAIDGRNFDDIVNSSKYTIIQLYSENCGFCNRAVSLNNELNEIKNLSVVALSGTENYSKFLKHLDKSDIRYSFIVYEGKYAELGLLKALGQEGFPTYLVIDSAKKLLGIFVGSSSLEEWLAINVPSYSP